MTHHLGINPPAISGTNIQPSKTVAGTCWSWESPAALPPSAQCETEPWQHTAWHGSCSGTSGLLFIDLLSSPAASVWAALGNNTSVHMGMQETALSSRVQGHCEYVLLFASCFAPVMLLLGERGTVSVPLGEGLKISIADFLMDSHLWNMGLAQHSIKHDRSFSPASFSCTIPISLGSLEHRVAIGFWPLGLLSMHYRDWSSALVLFSITIPLILDSFNIWISLIHVVNELKWVNIHSPPGWRMPKVHSTVCSNFSPHQSHMLFHYSVIPGAGFLSWIKHSPFTSWFNHFIFWCDLLSFFYILENNPTLLVW